MAEEATKEAAPRVSRRVEVLVWLCRLAVGAVFMLSGWAKAVDPAGFVIKIGEYLSVWGWRVPHEAVVAGAVALSAVEFCTGALIATGCLKRTAVWAASLLMAFMLPLTAYIAIVDPVPDCGCFGELFVVSNGVTFAKNVVIVALIVPLLKYNRRVAGLYPNPVQWLVATVASLFPLIISIVGYNIQPVSDFRPFPLGSIIFHPEVEETAEEYIYERDGSRRAFSLDSLPGDDWTFVEVRGGMQDDAADIAVRDADGDDVSYDIVSDDSPQAWLVIPNPGMQFLTRAHYVTELHRYLEENGIDFAALVGSHDDGYRYWLDLVHPRFPVYSAEDTALEQLARGNAAVVYTIGGRIVWKRTLASLPDDLLERPLEEGQSNVLDTVQPVDDGRLSVFLAVCFLAALLLLYFLGLSPKLLRLITAHTPKPAPQTK